MNRLIPDETFEAGVRLREEEGLTVKEICQRLGGSRGSWNWYFLSRGVERYGRLPTRCPRKGPLDDKILRLRQRKYSYAKIGALLGCDRSYVQQRVLYAARRQEWFSESCTIAIRTVGRRQPPAASYRQGQTANSGELWRYAAQPVESVWRSVHISAEDHVNSHKPAGLL